jgi:uncharacterized protein
LWWIGREALLIMRNTTRATLFYAITLSLALLVALIVPVIGEASLLVTMLMPTVAVAIMLTIVSREGGLREMISALGLDRIGFKGWPLAIAGPVAIHLAGFVILFAAGLAVFVAPEITGPAAAVPVKILIGFMIGTVLALGEEIGWRGYMLPRLLGLGFLPAALLVGFLHGVWHLPIMLTTPYYHSTGNPFLVVPLFLATLTLAGVFYGFLRIWTGSVWPVAIAHAAANNAWEIMTELTKTKSPLVLEYIGGESGLIMIAGLVIVNIALIRYMRRPGFRPKLSARP